MILLVLALSSIASVAYAQPAAKDDDDEGAPVQVQAQFEIHPDNFDQWVFGNQGGRDNGLNKLKAQLTLRCVALDRTCQLTDDQKKKIELAGRGDIKRYADRVEEVREKFMAVRKDQEKFNQIWNDIHPLQNRLNAGLFNEESLLAKTIRSTLSTEQLTAFQSVESERKKFRYRAKVELVVAGVEATIPFTDEQRQKIITMIFDETEPPKRFGQYDYYVVMLRASQIPEAKWKSILDKEQHEALKKNFQQVRGMEQFLKSNGIIEDKKDPAAAK